MEKGQIRRIRGLAAQQTACSRPWLRGANGWLKRGVACGEQERDAGGGVR